MKRFRTVLFWIHLACGVVAGVVILIMSFTGAVLAFKPQIVALVERDVRTVRPPADGVRLGMGEMLARVRAEHPGAPASITLDANPSSSVAVSYGRDETVYVDPYSGRVLGSGSAGTQAFFRSVEDWHRWLAVSGDGRASARGVTDACNAAFLVLAVTGIFIWWPHKWLPQHLKAILWFRRTKTSRARDFNWHNAIGFWCAPVLIVLTATGVVMSYPWANNLVYRMTDSPLPSQQRGPGGPAGRPGGAAAPDIPANLDALWARAEQRVAGWSSISMRWPARPTAPVSFTITDGTSWNKFARSQLQLDAATGEVVRWEPYSGQSRGQRLRLWIRFSHTGELGRWPGQAIAGLACVGGVVLVWTGLALAYRRFVGWKLWARMRSSPAGVGQES
jgi:uncharacterized iron-regulated membrane protein